MYDPQKLKEIKNSLEQWEGNSLHKTLASMPTWTTHPILDCRAATRLHAESTRRFTAANSGR
jgi:hypothetical protein